MKIYDAMRITNIKSMQTMILSLENFLDANL